MRSIILSCEHLNRSIEGLRCVPNVEVLNGYPTPKGEDGCLEMHKTAVRMARGDKDPAVFVLEDDAEFTPHFNWERWLTDAAWADANGYDVMVGGSTRTYHERVVRAGMIEVRAFHSAHCLVYFARGYEKVLQAVQPFDLSLGSDVQTNYQTSYVGCRIVLVHPFVAVQRATYSGILKKPVNYVPEYVKHEAKLQRTFRLGLRRGLV